MKFLKLVSRSCSFFGILYLHICLIFFFSGIFPYIVLSGSMDFISLPTGSVIFIQTREIDIKPGDVILYTNSTGNITHRVVMYQNETYVTKGDANSTRLIGSCRKRTDKRKGSVSHFISWLYSSFSQNAKGYLSYHSFFISVFYLKVSISNP